MNDFLIMDKEEDLNNLLKYQNIKKLEIHDIILSNYNLNIISKLNLNRLILINCVIENLSLITNLELIELQIINCEFDDFEYINDFNLLENLTLQKLKEIDLQYLPIIKKIKKLDLADSYIKNEEFIIFCNNLEELRISGTNLTDLSLLLPLNLKRLIIDTNRCDNVELLPKTTKIIDEIGSKYD